MLGILEPESGEVITLPLGAGSRPHDVMVGPDGNAWVTDGGQTAIVKVDADTHEVSVYPLPEDSGYANLNTATFDNERVLWFTGQAGLYGRFDHATEKVEVFEAPRGPGPYGITTTPGGRGLLRFFGGQLRGSH